MARSFTEQLHRLQGNTAAEIKAGWDHLALRYGRDFEFQGRVLKAGPMLSILALHFLRLSDDERRALLGRMIPELERLLAEDEDVDGFLKSLDEAAPGKREGGIASSAAIVKDSTEKGKKRKG